MSARTSVAELGEALGLGLALGLTLLALLLLALAAAVLDVDDAYRGAERAVATVGLEVLAAAAAAAAIVAAVGAAAALAVATATAAALAAASAAPAPAALVGAARVDDGLDVADRGGREAHPGGEGRVAGLDALGLLAADGGPLHRLAVLTALGLERLQHGVRAADALDCGGQAGLGAGGAAGGGGRRRRGLLLLGLRGLRLGLGGFGALGGGSAVGGR